MAEKIKTIPVTEDLGSMLVSALRYALGRRTYITSLTAEYIVPLVPYLSYRVLNVMNTDLNRYEDDRQNNLIEDDDCDYHSWNILHKVVHQRILDLEAQKEASNE